MLFISLLSLAFVCLFAVAIISIKAYKKVSMLHVSESRYKKIIKKFDEYGNEIADLRKERSTYEDTLKKNYEMMSRLEEMVGNSQLKIQQMEIALHRTQEELHLTREELGHAKVRISELENKIHIQERIIRAADKRLKIIQGGIAR